jgi:hypothetical protein
MEDIKEECLLSCNGLSHLSLERRAEVLHRLAAQGCVLACKGPRPGQYHPICQQPEATKVEMVADKRRALAAAACQDAEVLL